MQLNFKGKKIVEKKTLDELEGQAADIKRSIELRKEISSGGEEAIRVLSKFLQQYHKSTTLVQHRCFQEPSETNSLKAHVHAGELNVLNFIIDLIENKSAIDNNTQELRRLEKLIDEYKSLPIRER